MDRVDLAVCVALRGIEPLLADKHRALLVVALCLDHHLPKMYRPEQILFNDQHYLKRDQDCLLQVRVEGHNTTLWDKHYLKGSTLSKAQHCLPKGQHYLSGRHCLRVNTTYLRGRHCLRVNTACLSVNTIYLRVNTAQRSTLPKGQHCLPKGQQYLKGQYCLRLNSA